MDVAENNKAGDGGASDCEDRTVKRSLRSKNSNGATGYLTPNARQTFTQSRQTFTKALIL